MTAALPLKKTTKGLTELAGAVYSLDLKSRQLLILADGQRGLEQIQQLRPNLDVHGIAQRLIAEGYLTGGDVEPHAAAHRNESLLLSQAITEEPTLSEEAIVQAKSIMIETTHRYVGILGSDLIRKISEAQSPIQIRNCIAQWNMAIRDSRQGRAVADQHLKEVRFSLEFEPSTN